MKSRSLTGFFYIDITYEMQTREENHPHIPSGEGREKGTGNPCSAHAGWRDGQRHAPRLTAGMQLLSHCGAPAHECSQLRSRCAAAAAAAAAGSRRGTGAEGERERTARERREGRKRVITGGRRGGARHSAPGCPHPGRGMGARVELWWGPRVRGARDTLGSPRIWAPLWRGMRRQGEQASMRPLSLLRAWTTGRVLKVTRCGSSHEGGGIDASHLV